MSDFCADDAAAFILAQFRAGSAGLFPGAAPQGRADAYAVQDRVVAALGGACGWKVGRGRDDPEPYCAPLPRTRLLASGGRYARHHGKALVEAELGFRLGRDVPNWASVGDRARCAGLIDAIVPAIEILETRLSPPAAQQPLWKLADLQANGGVVLGEPVAWTGQDVGTARLALGGEAERVVDHPFGAPLDLFAWTVEHVARHRGGLRRGDVIITGSYCGIVEIAAPQRFDALFTGYGTVGLDIV